MKRYKEMKIKIQRGAKNWVKWNNLNGGRAGGLCIGSHGVEVYLYMSLYKSLNSSPRLLNVLTAWLGNNGQTGWIGAYIFGFSFYLNFFGSPHAKGLSMCAIHTPSPLLVVSLPVWLALAVSLQSIPISYISFIFSLLNILSYSLFFSLSLLSLSPFPLSLSILSCIYSSSVSPTHRCLSKFGMKERDGGLKKDIDQLLKWEQERRRRVGARGACTHSNVCF